MDLIKAKEIGRLSDRCEELKICIKEIEKINLPSSIVIRNLYNSYTINSIYDISKLTKTIIKCLDDKLQTLTKQLDSIECWEPKNNNYEK